MRVVVIEGFDQQADGGTHVANTSEIGRIRILKTENKGRLNKRIEVAVKALELGQRNVRRASSSGPS